MAEEIKIRIMRLKNGNKNKRNQKCRTKNQKLLKKMGENN